MNTNKFNKSSVAYARPIKFEIYSFIHCVTTYYDFPPNVTSRIENILTEIGSSYHTYFSGIPYENVVLGITVFAAKEFNQHFISESPPFDVSDYAIALYGEARFKRNITQIYYVLSIVDFVFNNEHYAANRSVLPVLN